MERTRDTAILVRQSCIEHLPTAEISIKGMVFGGERERVNVCLHASR